jgi:coenzyme F420-0:L-glutamate ligase / coenzyme F420-1:gamma-L-glutamate ligase
VPPVLTPPERAFLADARTATLATIDPDGHPRLVPVCFVLAPLDVRGLPVLHTPIDQKPKSTIDPYALARVRDIRERSAVSLLVQRWSENWDELAWLRVTGRAEVVEPIPRDVGARAVASALRNKYSQYAEHDLESRPLIMVTIERATSWFAADR